MGGMLAVIDETTPEIPGGGIGYSVISAVLLDEPEAARAVLQDVIAAARRRPWHWHREGISAKTAMVTALDDIGVVARAVVVPCGRSGQEAARAVALTAILEQLFVDGSDQLVIEARTPTQDGRDKATILRTLQRLGAAGQLGYRWERKTNELLWVADAIAGAVHEHLTQSPEDWYDQIVTATDLTLDYRSLPPR